MKNMDFGGGMMGMIEKDERKFSARVRRLLGKMHILKKKLPESSKDCLGTENPAVNAVLEELGKEDSKI